MFLVALWSLSFGSHNKLRPLAHTRGILCTLGSKCSSYHFLIQLCTSLIRVLNREMRRAHSPRGKTRLDPDGVRGPASAEGRKTKICPSDKQLVRKVKGRAACLASAAGQKRSGAAQAARRRPWLLPPRRPARVSCCFFQRQMSGRAALSLSPLI